MGGGEGKGEEKRSEEKRREEKRRKGKGKGRKEKQTNQTNKLLISIPFLFSFFPPTGEALRSPHIWEKYQVVANYNTKHTKKQISVLKAGAERREGEKLGEKLGEKVGGKGGEEWGRFDELEEKRLRDGGLLRDTIIFIYADHVCYFFFFFFFFLLLLLLLLLFSLALFLLLFFSPLTFLLPTHNRG